MGLKNLVNISMFYPADECDKFGVLSFFSGLLHALVYSHSISNQKVRQSAGEVAPWDTSR